MEVKKIALKVDVDTYRGTLEGVPPLLDLLKKYRAGATFLFSLGPDHTGRALKRILRPGFLGKVMRTSVGANYGLKTLCYGVLLPGPHIGRRAAAPMRAARETGFEVGVHTYDHVLWQDHVASRDEPWTRRQIELACDSFREVFGFDAEVHGAAGWQINDHAVRLEPLSGFKYASDTRGSAPFLPVIGDETIACPQLPTTLPTFDELIGIDGCTEGNVFERLLRRSEQAATAAHVFTLHAELEGMRLRPAFERLLQEWSARGMQLCAMQDIYEGLTLEQLPRCRIEMRAVAGRSGVLACQGRPIFSG
jgi:undecaprenyl phosphate-alpha-L-ara4FN deformylase